jgi:Rhs element Vgr protein
MGLPDLKISCDGRPLPDGVEVVDLDVRLAINRVPQASITLLDGSIPEGRFSLSDERLLAPGSKVRISLGHLSDGPAAKPVFEGIVTRHAVSSTAEGCRLRLELSDRALLMTRQRCSAVYSDATDGEVMRKLIQAAGLKAGSIVATPITHPALVQFNVSDWDFVLARADALGLAVVVSLGQVSVKPLSLGQAKRLFNHGLGDTQELELELDGAQQWSSLSTIAWDPATLKPSRPVKAKPPGLRIGNQSDQQLAKAVDAAEASLIHPAPVAPKELQSWADARLGKQRWSLLRGSLLVDGDADLNPLDTVEIDGVGERFNGKALLSEVTHTLNSEGWCTRLTLGVGPECFARSPDLEEMPAAGLLPAATGLQIATVESLDDDPKGELRVQVRLAVMGDKTQGRLWARLLSPDAGPKRGFVFRPEVGDEVLVGFLNEDPRQPLILGALFGGVHKPPKPVETPAKDNPMRAIVSRAGTRIVFDDAAPALRLETTASGDADGDYKNCISINEKEKTISIEDQHKNQILLTEQGISISTEKDIQLTAKGEVMLKGDKGVKLEGNTLTLKGQQVELAGQSKVVVKGAQVEVAANATLKLQGGAQTSLASDAMVDIKGSLVKIN